MVAVFPDSLPLTEIKTVIDIVRTGTIKTRTAEFTLGCWWCAGYALKMVGGGNSEPDSAAITIMSAEDPVAVLEKVVAQAEGTSVSPQMVIPWGIILNWALAELVKLLTKS